MNALRELIEHGQSYWLDNLTRDMMRDGSLERRVRDEGLRGLTSNPAIFHKGITTGDDYERQIVALTLEGRTAIQIYEELVVSDIREACDILRPVYDESGGVDGYASLEVNPYLVHDTEGSLEEARRLWNAVERPNLFIKIPGSAAGVPAIEQLLVEGINVNVTLLFSLHAYESVVQAHVTALERRLLQGLPVDKVHSVASFFLSRIDVLVDELLGQRVVPGREGETLAQHLFGEAAVASARLAYQQYLEVFGEERWKAVSAAGGHAQRLLWASTSTKNPLYDEIRYVEPLIGRDTVNTMPEATIEAFARRGQIAPDSIEQDVEGAKHVMDSLRSVGIDIDRVTQQLLDEGAQKFLDPFDALIGTLADKRAEVLGERLADQEIAPGTAEGAVRSTLASMREQRFVGRLYDHDASLWAADAEQAAAISNRLGWMADPMDSEALLEDIMVFANEIRDEGVRRVVLLGMGGSSLCAEVAVRTFGPAPGRPDLVVLDDTAPAAVQAVQRDLDPASTLFIVASKSGTTIETMSLYRYFYEACAEAGIERPGRQFIAITDPGTPLAEEAAIRDFRAIFETPVDVGGRYSVLTPFGLVPMALLGIDVRAIVRSARNVYRGAGPQVPEAHSPPVRLGATLGALARSGRDKVTFLAEPALAAFPLWLEQLLAESSGKDGRGLIPVVDEPRQDPEAYGDDRVFVYLGLEGEPDAAGRRFLEALVEAGHPAIFIEIPSLDFLGGEFLRWEMATAALCFVLGVNPFDEPNVTESKKNTAELLELHAETGSFPGESPLATEDGVRVFGAAGSRTQSTEADSAADLIRDFVDLAYPDDYHALLTYFPGSPDVEEALEDLKAAIKNRTDIAVTQGYGPRYLHSTGQLHKGGPPTGIFLILTADAVEDLDVPDAAYSFGELQRAQALGDFGSLVGLDRRVLRVDLGWDAVDGVRKLTAGLS